MPYCTKAQVRVQFPLITDTIVIDATLDDYIARADGMINTALGKEGYVVPVVSPTKDIEMWSIYGAALQAGIQVIGTPQSNSAFAWPDVMSWYQFIKDEAKMGILQIPRNSSAPSVSSDSLTDPDFSEFKTEVELNSD